MSRLSAHAPHTATAHMCRLAPHHLHERAACVCEIDIRAVVDRQYVYCGSLASVRRMSADHLSRTQEGQCRCCTAPSVNKHNCLGDPKQRKRSEGRRGADTVHDLIRSGESVPLFSNHCSSTTRRRKGMSTSMMVVFTTTIRLRWLDTREMFGRLRASTSMAVEAHLMDSLLDSLCLCLAASLAFQSMSPPNTFMLAGSVTTPAGAFLAACAVTWRPRRWQLRTGSAHRSLSSLPRIHPTLVCPREPRQPTIAENNFGCCQGSCVSGPHRVPDSRDHDASDWGAAN